MEKNVHVAVVDDGINEKLYSLGQLEHDLEITGGLEIIKRKENGRVDETHGTTCTAIIKKYAPQAVISSIKVLGDNAKGFSEQLVKAIIWCADNKTNIMNLSLGSINFRDFEAIRNAVNYASRKGVILVAACHNSNVVSYPASLSNVIGVKCDWSYRLKEGQFEYNSYAPDGVEIVSCASHFLIPCDGKGRSTKTCNSFAAPMVSGIICNILSRQPQLRLHEIRAILYSHSKNQSEDIYFHNIFLRTDWVEKAAVVCNKEESKCASVKAVLIENDILDSDTDTVVLADAYPDKKMLDRINQAGKSMIYMGKEDILQKAGGYTGIRHIWTPAACRNFYVDPDYGKEVDIPSVVLYDITGRNQAKSLSELVHRFRDEGYYAVGAINEEEGVLYGLEYMPGDIRGKTCHRTICGIYNPDILLTYLSCGEIDASALQALEAEYCPDIRVIIVDALNSIHRILPSVPADNDTVILYIGEKGPAKGEQMPEYPICDSIKGLYPLIMGMLEIEEEQMPG